MLSVSISSPSLFDFDAISTGESEKRLTHAFNLATTSYGVPSLFETKRKYTSYIILREKQTLFCRGQPLLRVFKKRLKIALFNIEDL